MDNNHEALADLLISKAENIPDNVKKAFIRRSLDDAKNILKEEDNISLEKLTYIIYRAYSLGAALYDGDKLISYNDKTDKQKSIKDKYEKIDNTVVYLKR